MPVLQVPVGEDGGPGGLANLMKDKGKKKDEEEEKKEDGDDDKEMEGKRRVEEDMQNSRVVEEFMLMLDGISVGGTKHKREGSSCNVCDKALKSLATPNQYKI